MTEIVDEITPLSILAYLRSKRWQLERDNDRRSIWAFQSSRVFIPKTREEDFAELIAKAVGEIARLEQRPNSEVLLDIAWRGFDKLKVCRETGAAGLAMSDGVELHKSLFDLVRASAATVTRRKRFVDSSSVPTQAQQYLDQVRLVPSAQGSFIVRALLPLAPKGEQDNLPDVIAAAPDTRKVSAAILAASSAAIKAATDVTGGASAERWDEAVEEGVSSNLCEALSRMVGDRSVDGGRVEIAIDWTWAAPQEPIDKLSIATGLAPILSAGSEYLRVDQEETAVRITGLVTNLHRDIKTGPGDITVSGYISGAARQRNVRVGLDEASYKTAIAAHDSGYTVEVDAVVKRTYDGLKAVSVSNFRVVPT